MADEKTLELIAILILMILITGAMLVNVLPYIIWARRSKNAETSPLSDEKRELLSKKIEAINASGGENELVDYVWKTLRKKDFSVMADITETLVGRFEKDVFIAKNFRNDCQNIMDTGSMLDVDYVFTLEDEFFDGYRRVKVLKLAECEDHKAVRMALDDVHKSAAGMAEYLKGFHRNERKPDLDVWQDRIKYNLNKEKLVM